MTSALRRVGVLDVAITLVMSGLGVLMMLENIDDPEVQAPWAVVPFFLLVTLPLLWRRSAPLAAAGASLVALLLNEALFGTDVVRCGTVLPVAFLYSYAAGAHLPKDEGLRVLGVSCGLIAVEGVAYIGPFALFIACIAAGLWGIGRLAQSRVRMARALQARTRELRAARDETARLEVATDRARLSGELDGLLQRRLGELARLADERPDDPVAAKAALAAIEVESRRTLDEMRSLVGVLRDDGEQAPTEPMPTLTHLEHMLVRAKGAGSRLTVEGSPRVLPAGVELSAYRIVEHLLDALEDEPGVEVVVNFEGDQLELRIAGHARRGARASFDRARQRAEVQHGSVRTTTRGGRAEAVVSLPVLAAV